MINAVMNSIRAVRSGTVRLSIPFGLTPSITVANDAQTKLRTATWMILKICKPLVAKMSRKAQHIHAPRKDAKNTASDPSTLLVHLPIVYLCFPYFAPTSGAIPSPRYIAVRAIAARTKKGVKVGSNVKIDTSIVIEMA